MLMALPLELRFKNYELTPYLNQTSLIYTHSSFTIYGTENDYPGYFAQCMKLIANKNYLPSNKSLYFVYQYLTILIIIF